MGATNSTPNYGLSQFIGTDKPAWLQDYNGDMLKIDTGINGAKVAADNAANAASAAQGDATTALGGVSSLNTTVGTLSNTVGTAVGNINTINSLIGNGTPTTTDQTIIGAINELNADKAEASDLANIHLGEVLKYTADTSATDRAHQLNNMYSAYSNLSNNEKIHSYIKRGSYIYRCTSHGNTGMYVTEIEDNGDIRTEMLILSSNASNCKLLRYVVTTSNTITFTNGSSESASSDLELYISHVTT